MSIRSNITQEELDELVEDDYSNTYQSIPARSSVERDLAIAELARKLSDFVDQVSSILRMKYGR